MAAVRHFGFVVCVFGTTHEEYWVAISVVQNWLWIGWRYASL